MIYMTVKIIHYMIMGVLVDGLLLPVHTDRTFMCSWEDDEEIYDGMYEYDDSNYPTEWDIQREKEYQKR